MAILNAVKHFEAVAKENPLDPSAHHNLAAAYHKAKRLEDALRVTSHCQTSYCPGGVTLFPSLAVLQRGHRFETELGRATRQHGFRPP